jgi:hypothetical protein
MLIFLQNLLLYLFISHCGAVKMFWKELLAHVRLAHPLHINDFPCRWGAGGLTKERRPLVSLCGRRVPYERRFITKSSRRPQKIGFPVMFAFAALARAARRRNSFAHKRKIIRER